MATAAQTRSIPRVQPDSTANEVAEAASQVLHHRLFDELSDVEQDALLNPHNNIRKTHAILVKMRRTESRGSVSGNQAEQTVSQPVAPKSSAKLADLIANRNRADEVLADELLCWAIARCGHERILRQLASIKPAIISRALADLSTIRQQIDWLIQLRLDLHSAAIDVVDMVYVEIPTTMIELNQLWQNAVNLIEWLDRCQHEMRSSIATDADKVRRALDEDWYEPDRLSVAIEFGDRVLGRHITSRQAKRRR